MFLKKDTLTYGDASVELYELSGLQRIEYLEYIQQRTAQYDRETEESTATEEERRVAFLRMGVDINAWRYPAHYRMAIRRGIQGKPATTSPLFGRMRRWGKGQIWCCP